ncbi:hypothetical protein WMY93_027808 [Mugilogobius chulae]|uniref:DNA endonuclease Ctp1 N-terminal domain-containing protein n=1 Tax=Mugilogobius chulae TaxID=88201 RepID=A0AAW0MYC0_9GOBI
MDEFNDLLLKLQECHEREIEGWQVKLQELSNKKAGDDTKRMEELYTRNQQMKEQQKILTENIKTLENRLRAGLCDRCTVTQEVAKKRQQDFETMQLQSMQHMTLMVADINNLKKENKMLRDEARSLRAALESHSEEQIQPGSPPGKPRTSVSLSSSITSSPSLSSLSSLPPVIEAPPSRHILHAPVPCRPQPLKTSSGPLPPWSPLGEPPDWATATAASQCSKPRFPNLIPSSQHVNSHSAARRPAPGQVWHKPAAAQQNPNEEATVVVRLRNRAEQERGVQRAKEKQSQAMKSEEGSSREGSECEGPLDLSDSGRSKPAAGVSSPPGGAVQNLEGQETKTGAEEKKREEQGKKVPVLTISLRPVVLLESLNTQKHDSSSSNQNSPEEAAGGSSSDEREDDSGESSCGEKKRKRHDSDSGQNVRPERKVRITVRKEESAR